MSVCAFLSCNKENDVNPLPEEEEIPITLSSDLSGGFSFTRAYYVNNDALKTNGFGIYGYKKKSDTYTPVFNADHVIFDNTLQLWHSVPLKYWDKAADSYIFAAYGPQDAQTSITAPDAAGNASITFSNIPQWQDITTTDNQALAKDYIVARHTDNVSNYLTQSPYYRQDRQGVVPFSFYHLLSRLTVQAYCEANEQPDKPFIVTKVELSSKGKITSGAGTSDATHGLPKPTVMRTALFKYTKAISSPDKPLDASELVFNSDEIKDSPDKLDMFGPIDVYCKDNTEAIAPSYVPSAPTILCRWLVAPFVFSDVGSILYDDPNSTPYMTLQVWYCVRHKVSSDPDVYEYDTPKESQLINLSELEAESAPLLTQFEKGKDYVITLNIKENTISVVLDVASTPWNNGGEFDNSVYNW